MNVTAHDSSDKPVRAARRTLKSQWGGLIEYATVTFGEGLEVIVHSKDTAYLDRLTKAVEEAARTPEAAHDAA